MRSLNDTIHRLSALRTRDDATGAGSPALATLPPFGSNPGALRGHCHVPENLPENAPLVVVLHGCMQDAAAYDRGSGWSQLADRHGFAVLYPEQTRSNNPNMCFNWFNPQDTRRDSGEALSIRQMIGTMIDHHAIDPRRIHITGLSAGGAMTSVMLATYPELFAGGAIIAGLPYGTAGSVPEAFDRMRAHGGPAGPALGALVTGASTHSGPWPTISVWHGSGDGTVSPENAGLVIEQWRSVHGLDDAPTLSEEAGSHRRRVWRDAAGRDVIEEFQIPGLGHGTPISATGGEACGIAGPYMLEAGISSTRRIAAFWDLAQPAPAATAAVTARSASEAPRTRAVAEPAPPPRPRPKQAKHPVSSVTRVIEDALRSAGLMK